MKRRIAFLVVLTFVFALFQPVAPYEVSAGGEQSDWVIDWTNVIDPSAILYMQSCGYPTSQDGIYKAYNDYLRLLEEGSIPYYMTFDEYMDLLEALEKALEEIDWESLRPKATAKPIRTPTPGRTPKPTTAPDYNPQEPIALSKITDVDSAVNAVDWAIKDYIEGGRYSELEEDYLFLFSEEAIAQVATKRISGSEVAINSKELQELSKAAVSARNKINKVYKDNKFDTGRSLRATVTLIADNTEPLNITLDSSSARLSADNIVISTPQYEIGFSKEFMKNNTDGQELNVTVETQSVPYEQLSKAENDNRYVFLASEVSPDPQNEQLEYTVTFNKETVRDNVKISVEPLPSEMDYQTLTHKETGTTYATKQNPTTKMMETAINRSGTFLLRDNKQDFTDILDKSVEMQKAIQALAAQNIIKGTTATTFSPDNSVTRAEIAAMIVNALCKNDPHADGGFTDVPKDAWYHSAVGSAKQLGYVSGVTATRFDPGVVIPKLQITALSARVLRSEMGYEIKSSDAGSYLSQFQDAHTLASWSRSDIALAVREKLVVYRTDSKFMPDISMTRGDAAMVLHRMFMKIWP